MSSFLEKIKRFFKRGREEDETSSEKSRAKRARYISTPATIKFHPKQVHQKRVIRHSYLLDELLDVTEDRNYEFKSGGMLLQKNTLKLMIQKYGSAFLNSEGGVLIGGVNDTGKVIGINCSVRQEVELEDTVENEFKGFRPCVDKDKYIVKFLPVRRRNSSLVSGLKVVEIHIYKGDDDHLYETGNHEVYIRRDGGVQGPLRPLAIKDLVEQKYQKVLVSRKEDGKKDERSSNPRNQNGNKSNCRGQQSQKSVSNLMVIDLTKDNPGDEPQKSAAQHLVEKPLLEQNVQGKLDEPISKKQPAQHNIRSLQPTTDLTRTERQLPKQIARPPDHRNMRRSFDSNFTARPPDHRNMRRSFDCTFIARPADDRNMRRSFDCTFTARPPDHRNMRRSFDCTFIARPPFYQDMQATTGQYYMEGQMPQQMMQGPPFRPYMERSMGPPFEGNPQMQQYMQASWNMSVAGGPMYSPISPMHPLHPIHSMPPGPPVPPVEPVPPRFRIRRPNFNFARKFISDVKSVFK